MSAANDKEEWMGKREKGMENGVGKEIQVSIIRHKPEKEFAKYLVHLIGKHYYLAQKYVNKQIIS